MTAPVTRDHLAALIRGHVPGAAAEILRAVDAYARWKAEVIVAARDARRAAGLQTPDDPVVTARRRKVLAAAAAAPRRRDA